MNVTENSRATGRSILLVEDQAIIALQERRTLENHGYVVTVARTGEEAIEISRGNPDISLILMDIDLGDGIDGSEAAERILAERDIPVAFLSSHTEQEIVEKTEGITSYGYIVKNSGTTVLLASIRMAFRLHRATVAARSSARMMEAILDVSRRLVSTMDLQDILQTASDYLSELAGIGAGALYLLENGVVVLAAATPEVPVDFPDVYRRAPLDDHPHIETALTRKVPVVVADTGKDTWTAAEEDILRMRNLSSVTYVPMVSQQRSVGVFITGGTNGTQPADGSVLNLCVTLANIAAVAVENACLRKRSSAEG
jgi:CheY-like chemotaxis protein